MSDGQDKKWTQWDIEQAWLDVVAARTSGDIEAEALGMQRFSEGLRNSAMGAAGFVLRPLDEKIDKLTTLFEQSDIRQKRLEEGVEGRADYFYRHFESFLKDADARFNGYDSSLNAVLEAVSRLGGLPAQVADHEVRIVSLETHGVPAESAGLVERLEARVFRLEIVVIVGFVALAFLLIAALILLRGP